MATKVDRVHVLVANAGTTWGVPLAHHPDAAFAKVFDLNVCGVFNLVRYMCALLEAAGSAPGPARMITVGSVARIDVGVTDRLRLQRQQGGSPPPDQ